MTTTQTRGRLWTSSRDRRVLQRLSPASVLGSLTLNGGHGKAPILVFDGQHKAAAQFMPAVMLANRCA
jgi:hypothetical protein